MPQLMHSTVGESSEEEGDENTRPGLVVTNEDGGTPSTISTTLLSLVVGKGQLSLCTALPADEVIIVYLWSG